MKSLSLLFAVVLAACLMSGCDKIKAANAQSTADRAAANSKAPTPSSNPSPDNQANSQPAQTTNSDDDSTPSTLQGAEDPNSVQRRHSAAESLGLYKPKK